MQNKRYITLYKNNKFIDSFILLSFDSKIESLESIKNLVYYIDNEINSLKDKTGIVSFFYPFKKAIKTLYFINSFITESQDFIGKSDCDKIENWYGISNITTDILSKIENDIDFQSKFSSLLKEDLKLEDQKIIQVWLSNFFQNKIGKNKKVRYQKLKNVLDKKIDKFINNGNNKNNKIIIGCHQKYMLKGLNADLLSIGRENAKEVNKEGWVFYVDEGTTELLLRDAKVRSFRKKVYEAYQKQNTENDIKFNNDKILRDIVATKQKIAHMHKYNNYAELVLSNYVLNTPTKAYNYLNKIEDELLPLIDNLGKEINNRATNDGIKILKNWDIPFYIQRIKTENKNYNEINNFEDYFMLDNVLKGICKLLTKEFNLEIKELKREYINENLCITYHLYDSKTNHTGYFLLSPFDNEKKGSAYQSDLCSNEKVGQRSYLPSVQYISLDIEEKQGYQKMSHYDILVLLHELGHALHSFYANRNDKLLNDSLISWDLIELPSQFFEHLVYDAAFMKDISCHYKTGKKITKNILKNEFAKEQYFKIYETYREIKKYNAQLWLHENFKQYSQKSPYEIVKEIIGNNGLIYNITQDDYMLCNDHLKDYAPTGYIYLYSANIAFNLLKENRNNLKDIFTNVFNSAKIKRVEESLAEKTNLQEIDMLSFFKKGWNIKIHGEK